MQDENISYAHTNTGSSNDNELWIVARRRTAFKVSVASYVMVNSIMVTIWYFTSGPASYFWPIWSILGWGIGVVVQYIRTYHGVNLFSTQKEYEKLKKQQKN